MSDGLVHVFQETRDMYDMNDSNIYVVLDEGCNSTCHSKHWAEVVEKKLKNLGYEFQLVEPQPRDPELCRLVCISKTANVHPCMGYLSPTS